jgi:hypothetical protein
LRFSLKGLSGLFHGLLFPLSGGAISRATQA